MTDVGNAAVLPDNMARRLWLAHGHHDRPSALRPYLGQYVGNMCA